MWFQESFYKYTVGIILVLVIIALMYYTGPIFEPILWFIAAILLPILFSTFLYYALRPIIDLLERWMPRYLAIFTTYLVIGFAFTILGFIIGPQIVTDISSLSNVSPEKIEDLKNNTSYFVNRLERYLPIPNLPTIETVIFDNIQKINSFVYQLAVNMISTLTSIAIALALTPFVLFYFLRDANLLPRFILRFTPIEYQEEVQTIFQDIDKTLSNFILAEITIAGVVGLFLFVGYALIGLPQALSLSLFGTIFYVIPILGTFLAIIPALVVAMTISPLMTLKVIIVMFIANFLESYLIAPRIMSQSLKIHPLTIILLLLAAGKLYGLLGLLLITPTYALLKVIIWNIYKISRLRYAIAKSKTAKETSDVN